MEELHASSPSLGCGGDRPRDAILVRLQTEDRGGAFGIAPGKAAISCADLQDVAPPQSAQAGENTNLGPLGIKRVDHAIPALISRESNGRPRMSRSTMVARPT